METGVPYTIQQASWRDLHDLYRLEHACFDQDAWPMLDLLGVLTFLGVVRLKADWEGKMVGFIGGESRDQRQTGWIITLGVMEEFRGYGIAQRLLAECEKKLAPQTMRLCVRMNNEPAIRLYKKAGYIQVEIWPQYYRGGEDALVLEKYLVY